MAMVVAGGEGADSRHVLDKLTGKVHARRGDVLDLNGSMLYATEFLQLVSLYL